MKKIKLFPLVLSLLLIFNFIKVGAKTAFSDVPESGLFSDAVSYLSGRGIISGYEDGTFRPYGQLTRAEAATIIVRAGNLPVSDIKSTYSDVPNNHWARKYIMSATRSQIISGMGDGTFSPDTPVTYNQIIKMIVCLMDLEGYASDRGGWPSGYLRAALDAEVFDTEIYRALQTRGNDNAVRGDVAIFVYNSVIADLRGFFVNGTSYTLGMDAGSLPTPDETLPSTAKFTWYVYGTKTYENFFAAGVYDGKVVALSSSGKGFTYKLLSFGEKPEGSVPYGIYVDKNAGGTVHGVYIRSDSYRESDVVSDYTLAGESKFNFHVTNAFRVAHGKAPLVWDSKAATSARLHSKDMAEKDYFSHESLDGRKVPDRLRAAGISHRSYGENIAAGRSLGFKNYDAWVNSEGHRKNILSNQKYLGVGAAYNAASTYGYYFTQNFYS